MSESIVYGLVGSPNKDGRTFQLVDAALEGTSKAGAETELIQMSDFVVEPCRDCIPWVCLRNEKCTYPDNNFKTLSEKLKECGGLVFGTPVYGMDTSAIVKYFIIKMRRVHARAGLLAGLPAFGIAIAGNTGAGQLSGLRPLYQFFWGMQMRAIEPVPATQFNMEAMKEKAKKLGHQIGTLAGERKPFESRWLDHIEWYEKIPLINLNLVYESRYLAETTLTSIPEEKRGDLLEKLTDADQKIAAGKTYEALEIISVVYSSCTEILKETHNIL